MSILRIVLFIILTTLLGILGLLVGIVSHPILGILMFSCFVAIMIPRE